jgi:hypothetical protein
VSVVQPVVAALVDEHQVVGREPEAHGGGGACVEGDALKLYERAERHGVVRGRAHVVAGLMVGHHNLVALALALVGHGALDIERQARGLGVRAREREGYVREAVAEAEERCTRVVAVPAVDGRWDGRGRWDWRARRGSVAVDGK